MLTYRKADICTHLPTYVNTYIHCIYTYRPMTAGTIKHLTQFYR